MFGGLEGVFSGRSGRSPPDPDSGHWGEAVCRPLLLFLPCHFALRVVCAFKQKLVEHAIRHSDVMRQHCRHKQSWAAYHYISHASHNR